MERFDIQHIAKIFWNQRFLVAPEIMKIYCVCYIMR